MFTASQVPMSSTCRSSEVQLVTVILVINPLLRSEEWNLAKTVGVIQEIPCLVQQVNLSSNSYCTYSFPCPLHEDLADIFWVLYVSYRPCCSPTCSVITHMMFVCLLRRHLSLPSLWYLHNITLI